MWLDIVGKAAMNWLDIVIILALVIPTFVGYKIGLVKMVLPLVGALFGVILACALHGYLADLLDDSIDSEAWAHIVSFLAIFIAVFAVMYFSAFVLQKMLKMVFLGMVEKLAGAALVFITVWLICSFIMAMVAKYGALGEDYLPGGIISSESVENTVDGSALATFQVAMFPVIIGLLPDEFDVVKEYFQD